MGATLNDRRALDTDYHGLSNNQKNSNRTHRVGPCFLNQPSADPKAAQCHYDMWQDKAQAPPEIIDSLYYSANVFAIIARIPVSTPDMHTQTRNDFHCSIRSKQQKRAQGCR